MNKKTTVISQAQLSEQHAFCDKIAAYWHEQNSTPAAYVETYGCQQNEADSERIRGMLQQSGYSIVAEAEGADVVVMNTCAIREHAEQRVFGNLGALTHTKRRHPGQKIFLCGCMAGQEQVVERLKKSFPHVDGVFSTHHLWQFPEILYNVLTRGKRQFYVTDEPGSIAEGLPVVRSNILKAWVSIMYGCNNFCTYCIVPYVRGRERSRKMEDILAECRELIDSGCKEITLLGQNVNSYGKDLDEGVDFSDLLAAIAQRCRSKAFRHHGRLSQDRQAAPSPLPVRLFPGSEGYEPSLRPGKILRAGGVCQVCHAGSGADFRRDRGLPRRDGGRIRGDHLSDRAGAL